MKFKTITKERNKKRIIMYYILALIFFGIGAFLRDSKWYILAGVFLSLALIRKYWLMKRLKE
tara:strand:- start:6239 stop:6424 length:186 start_codon:yes stop_codon:yes gene_type:complete